MKLAEIIALLVAVLGLAAALEGFFNVSFSTKLFALAVVGGLLFWVVARRLNDWLRVKFKPGVTSSSRPRRSTGKLVVAILALGIIGISFCVVALLVMRFYAINVEAVVPSDDRGDFWIQGSRQVASKLTVSVPPGSEFECSPIGNNTPRSQTVLVDWDSLKPYLQITNFSYPQRQGVSCSPRPTIDRFDFRVEPVTLDVLLPDPRLMYKKLFVGLGGILWIASTLFVTFRSR